MGTVLGSLIAKIRESEDLRAQTIALFDACWVTMRPEIYWADPDDPDVRYTDAEAKAMGYCIVKSEKVVELVEVEGDMITDYIPINPDPDIIETAIGFNVSHIMYNHQAKNPEELERYVNHLMGRSKVKELA